MRGTRFAHIAVALHILQQCFAHVFWRLFADLVNYDMEGNFSEREKWESPLPRLGTNMLLLKLKFLFFFGECACGCELKFYKCIDRCVKSYI